MDWSDRFLTPDFVKGFDLTAGVLVASFVMSAAILAFGAFVLFQFIVLANLCSVVQSIVSFPFRRRAQRLKQQKDEQEARRLGFKSHAHFVTYLERTRYLPKFPPIDPDLAVER